MHTLNSTTTLPVKLVSASGTIVEAEFLLPLVVDGLDYIHRLILRFDGEEIAAADVDYFSALAAIRSALEPRGLVPRCYGASRNVYPSGMLRDSGGDFAYRMYLGRHAASADVVYIFRDGPDVDPVSVQVQEEFFLDWQRSLERLWRAEAAAAARAARRSWLLPGFLKRKG